MFRKPAAETRTSPARSAMGNNATMAGSFSILGADVAIKGDLTASADLHIDGKPVALDDAQRLAVLALADETVDIDQPGLGPTQQRGDAGHGVVRQRLWSQAGGPGHRLDGIGRVVHPGHGGINDRRASPRGIR